MLGEMHTSHFIYPVIENLENPHSIVGADITEAKPCHCYTEQRQQAYVLQGWFSDFSVVDSNIH